MSDITNTTQDAGPDGIGVNGDGTNGIGVNGDDSEGIGVNGEGDDGIGVNKVNKVDKDRN